MSEKEDNIVYVNLKNILSGKITLKELRLKGIVKKKIYQLLILNQFTSQNKNENKIVDKIPN